ncbi:MAG: cell division FtsA domain-containing protein [Acidaminobacteraceae bacterium]
MNEFKITKEMENNLIFSLDIGTRNVVGTLSLKDDENYVIIDHEILEHPERAMFDGQIHDIDKVAKVVRKVKEALEIRNDIKLTRVAIAAAGRALKTTKVTIARELDFTKTITKDIIDNIEMEGIQDAQKSISSEIKEREVNYYCVGYSVMRYYLDNSIIVNPKGHRGYELKIDIIATFLPHVVVDSLYTVVDRVGLEVINLTLEPIAAINVAIPENLRLLNLALVDVGAGTSDIAITKEGTIVSYGMVSMAGDKITETIASEFLLDFNSAEKLKIDLASSEEVSFSDVVGILHNIASVDILARIDEPIEKITTEISREIIEYNGKAPSAVFCIGGGCQIPGFLEKLALKLNIPKERVVIKGVETLQNIKYITEELTGPKFITPIGIGFTAFKDRDSDFLQVTVNEKPIKLFNSRKLTVLDALILVGFNPRSLIASRGQSYDVTINGKARKIYGEYGEAATLYVNGTLASLDTKLKNKDAIYIEKAVVGKKIYHKLEDLVKRKTVKFDGNDIQLITDLKINDKECTDDTIINEDNKITYVEIKTVLDLMEKLELDMNVVTVFVNGEIAKSNDELKSNDVLTYQSVQKTMREDKQTKEFLKEDEKSSIAFELKEKMKAKGKINYSLEEYEGELEPSYEETYDDEIHYLKSAEYLSANSISNVDKSDEYLVIDEPGFQFYKEPLEKKYKFETTNQVLFDYEFLVNGKKVIVNNSIKKLLFVDIFEYIDFDTKKSKGMINLTLNGKNVNYTDELKSGDVIEIGWR